MSEMIPDRTELSGEIPCTQGVSLKWYIHYKKPVFSRRFY